MTKLHIAYHVEELDEYREIVKTLGVFGNEERARDAIRKLKKLPEFMGKEDGFTIGSADLNATYWSQGFGID